MRTFMGEDEVIKIITESNSNNIYESTYCKNNNINLNTFRHFKKLHGLNSEKGKHKNSRKLRVYGVNDDYFNKYTNESCYYAGFIAADGNIGTHNDTILTINLQKRDIKWLEDFKDAIGFEGKIAWGLTRGIYPFCVIKLTSQKICKTLEEKFNITPRKSLTLRPPEKLDNKNHIDSFIKGYIDGDGTIGLYKSKKQEALSMGVMGTKLFILWIKSRFEEILNKKIKNFRKDRNIYVLQVTDKNARVLFQHFYNIGTPYLSRKWKDEYYAHCLNYKKYENVEKYKLIIKMFSEGCSMYEIAEKLNCTYQNIFWYTKRETYKQLLLEQ